LTKIWYVIAGSVPLNAHVEDFDQTMRDWRRGMNLTMFRQTYDESAKEYRLVEFEARGMPVVAIGRELF
jgi:hypothetical protein